MNKEYIEAFKIVYNNFDYLISDVCIENDDVNICLKTIKEQLPTIKRALQRLEAIEKGKNTDIIDNYMAFKNDNANPSEALKCLERIDKEYLTIESKDFDNCFNTIKQALLKAQELEKFFDDKLVFKNGCIMSGFDYKGKQIVAMPLEEYDEFMKQEKAQEPKQYLKWEDLEFNHTPKMIDVKMSGNKYKLVVGYNVAGKNLAILRDGKKEYYFLECDKQFFNDLHLERVEE